jgi:hypothetical protein
MGRCLGLLAVLVALAVPGSASAAVSKNGGSFSNSDPIAMPDNSVANPYPSTIPVGGLGGTVVRVRVILWRILAAARDVDVLLVSPAGASAIVMSDTCSGTDFSNQILTFDDAVANPLGPGPCFSFTEGVYKPTNYDVADTFPAAPPGPHAVGFSVFSGGPANGVWKLYVVDDQAPDAGAINGGWSLEVTTTGGQGKKCKRKGKGREKAVVAKRKRCRKKSKRR